MAAGFQYGAFQTPGFQQNVPSRRGGGYYEHPKRIKDREELDALKVNKDALRAMLEAAFADAPRDPVIAQEKREHRVIARSGIAVPRTDWSRLLGDLTACAAILDRYAERIGREATQTQRGEKEREDLRYSLESVEEMLDQVREFAAERRRVRRRAAIALLM